MTYSIIARDADTGQFGVAVQSHFLAVGANVPGLLAGVGAVASQANLRVEYKSDGLRMLSAGASAEEALAACLANDALPEVRQVAFIDSQGRTAAHTGSGCWNAAAHFSKSGVSAQANTVASPAIPEAMITAFETTGGSFAIRLLAALDAAEELGGDLRGRQSAAISIVGDLASRDAGDTLLDLRVDNDQEPLAQLRRAVDVAVAFAPLWRVIRGPACRGEVAPTPDETEEALLVLDQAQQGYGAENLEPTFWRAVAYWRASQKEEARKLVSWIARENPGWSVLFDDVTSRWPIP
ncbi:MAG: DUF1028 domain-containing protein [Cryobacterium sp.]|nr:DUF1028 domain-containing protein [Cryobacterium sp.]